MKSSPKNLQAAVSIVGNCPRFVDSNASVDDSAWVTRFNNAAGYGGKSGLKISELVLVSRGGQAKEWIDDPEFVCRRSIASAELITLVFPPTDDPGAECWFTELRQVLRDTGKTVTFIDEADHAYARETLCKLGACHDAALSSGFLYTHSKIRSLPVGSVPLHIYGFSFEGWDGHAWSAEAEWFRQCEAQGRLVLNQLNSAEQQSISP